MTSFPTESAFAGLPDHHQAGTLAKAVVEARKQSLPKALFASTTSGWQGNVVEIKTGQLRHWWHEIDDILGDVFADSFPGRSASTGRRSMEEAMGDLERVRNEIDDVIRSARADAPVHPDRPAG